MSSSTTNPNSECDDFCLRDRKVTATLLALLIVTCALPALVFHGGNGTVQTDNPTVAFLRDILQPAYIPVEDL